MRTKNLWVQVRGLSYMTMRQRDAAGKMRMKTRERVRELTSTLSTEEEEGPWDRMARRDEVEEGGGGLTTTW
jgi:hypothetical protein